MTTKILAIANQKGGVGKTTTALSLAAALSLMGKQVMVIDLDPHACATIHLAYYPEELQATILDVLALDLDEAQVQKVWKTAIRRDGDRPFDFVPSHIQLSDLESDLKDVPDKGILLKKRLGCLQGKYDYILIDCPPHVGVLLVNAIICADLLIIPIQTDFLALHGLRLLFNTVGMVNKVAEHEIDFRALGTMYDRRAGACRRALQILREKLGDKLFKTVINMDTKFREAVAQGKVIYEIAPTSRGAREYMRLAKEIIFYEKS